MNETKLIDWLIDAILNRYFWFQNQSFCSWSCQSFQSSVFISSMMWLIPVLGFRSTSSNAICSSSFDRFLVDLETHFCSVVKCWWTLKPKSINCCNVDTSYFRIGSILIINLWVGGGRILVLNGRLIYF